MPAMPALTIERIPCAVERSFSGATTSRYSGLPKLSPRQSRRAAPARQTKSCVGDDGAQKPTQAADQNADAKQAAGAEALQAAAR